MGDAGREGDKGDHDVESEGEAGIALDGDTIHLSGLAFTDHLAAQYLRGLEAGVWAEAIERMVSIGAYALMIGTVQATTLNVKAEVTDALHVPLDELLKALQEDGQAREQRLREAILRKQEKAARTPAIAGAALEDFVEALLSPLRLEATIERTSRVAGVEGDVGDICVDFPDGVRIALECKRGYDAGMSSARMREELKRARSNRQAQGGVLVLTTPQLLAGRRLLRLSDRDYVAVVSTEEGEDGLALHCALLLAHTHAAAGTRDGTDVAALTQQADALETAVQHHDDLLGVVNHIGADVDRARRLVEDARRAVQEAAGRLRQMTRTSQRPAE
jgi:hypothetical protein